MIQAVIFDIDGTLVDSVDLHAHAWQDAFAEFGKKISFQNIRDQIGKGGDEILPTYLTPKEIHSFGNELTKFRADVFKNNYFSLVTPFPKVRELFERIKQDGTKIALGSSAHEEELEHYIKLTKIDGLVDVKTCADDADKSKPHPDIFAVALQKLRVVPQSALVVGDSPYDALAAGKINIAAVGVLCGGFAPQVLTDAGAVALYGGPADLLAQYERTPLNSKLAKAG